MVTKFEIDPIREKYLAAESFFRWGKESFDEKDYETSRIFLGLSKALFNDLNQYEKCRKFVEKIEPLYKESCEKVGIAP